MVQLSATDALPSLPVWSRCMALGPLVPLAPLYPSLDKQGLRMPRSPHPGLRKRAFCSEALSALREGGMCKKTWQLCVPTSRGAVGSPKVCKFWVGVRELSVRISRKWPCRPLETAVTSLGWGLVLHLGGSGEPGSRAAWREQPGGHRGLRRELALVRAWRLGPGSDWGRWGFSPSARQHKGCGMMC